jgi:triacylglycerol lipase
MVDPTFPWQPEGLPTLRAAYSDRTAALMAYLARFAYDARVEIKGVAPAPSELAALGFTSFEVFENGFTDGFAYIAESPLLAVLAFRGTQSKANWKTNFHAFLTHPPGTDPKLRVHEGFYNAFNKLAVDGVQRKMKALIASPANIPIFITGHSLGGALAQIATAVFGSDKIAACYTFGSPRVGNVYFDLWVKPPSYRVINDADIVPQVPLPIIYHHSGDPRYMPATVNDEPYRFEPGPLVRLWQIIKGLVQLCYSGSVLCVADHSIVLYAAKLEQIAAARTQSR